MAEEIDIRIAAIVTQTWNHGFLVGIAAGVVLVAIIDIAFAAFGY